MNRLIKNIWKKSNALILLFLLILLTIVGCGQAQNQTKNPSVTEIINQMAQTVDISEMRKEDSEALEELYQIHSDDVEEFVLYTAPTNIEADELAIIKIKESSNIKDIKDSIAKRIEAQGNSFKDYIPEEYYLIENHVLKSKGNYILLVVSDKADKIEEIFDESFK